MPDWVPDIVERLDIVDKESAVCKIICPMTITNVVDRPLVTPMQY